MDHSQSLDDRSSGSLKRIVEVIITQFFPFILVASDGVALLFGVHLDRGFGDIACSVFKFFGGF